MNFLFSTAYAASTAQIAKNETTGGVNTLFSEMWHMLPFWIAGIVVVIAAFLCAGFFKKIVQFRLSRRDLHQEVLILIGRATYTATILLGLTIAFQIVGLDMGSLVAFLGVGIGFGLKDLLSNFIAGVMILTQKKFKIGDVVQVNDQLGKITEIESRTTQIRSFDGTTLVIPNAHMISAVVENFTSNAFRRVTVNVNVHYATPLQMSIQTATMAVKKHQKVVPDPAVSVVATEFGDSAINLAVRFWVESAENWIQVRSEVIQQIKIDFDEQGIEIPFPIQTLAIDQNDANLMSAIHRPVKTFAVATEPTAAEPVSDAEIAKN